MACYEVNVILLFSISSLQCIKLACSIICSYKVIVKHIYNLAMFLLRNIFIPVTILLFIFIQVTAKEENAISNIDNEISGSAQNGVYNLDTSSASYSSTDGYHGVLLNKELDNLTSNKVINIMMDFMLLSVISLRDFQNISIIGHDNPTINCNKFGGIYFENCRNCTITGITWEKCGTKNGNKPAIELYNSSEIIIQNCSFQHSVTQVLALSGMSRNVVITGCRFAFNNDFKGHGVAVYYISNVKHHFYSNLQLATVISSSMKPIVKV